MRRTDIFFIVTVLLVLAIMYGAIIFDTKIPIWLVYWWVILLPLGLAKAFYPKSKFVKWFETDIRKNKR